VLIRENGHRSRAQASVAGAASGSPTQQALACWPGRGYAGALFGQRRAEQNPLTQRPDEREVRELLAVLRAEHRDLDERIVRLEAEQSNDQVTIKRLKKQKLLLKDRITALEDQITPDIIA